MHVEQARRGATSISTAGPIIIPEGWRCCAEEGAQRRKRAEPRRWLEWSTSGSETVHNLRSSPIAAPEPRTDQRQTRTFCRPSPVWGGTETGGVV